MRSTNGNLPQCIKAATITVAALGGIIAIAGIVASFTTSALWASWLTVVGFGLFFTATLIAKISPSHRRDR